jgi:hypothetical protein
MFDPPIVASLGYRGKSVLPFTRVSKRHFWFLAPSSSPDGASARQSVLAHDAGLIYNLPQLLDKQI